MWKNSGGDHNCKGLPLDELPINLDAAEILVGQAGEGSRGKVNIVGTTARASVNYSSLNRFSFVCHPARWLVEGLRDTQGKVLTVNIDLFEAMSSILVFGAVKSDDELIATVMPTASPKLRIS